METIERRTFDFLSIMTGLVVLLFIGTSVYSLFVGKIAWQDFSGAVGPLAGLLLGYWVKGQ